MDRKGDVAVSAGTRSARLGLFSVVALGVNTIVGSGIFRLPAELARDLGPASVLSFAVCAALLATVALSYAEAGGMFAKDGGAYVYAEEALGRRAGFAIGWSTWVATVLTLSTVAIAVPGQLAELAPGADGARISRAIAAALIVVLGAVNLVGRKPGAWTSNVFLVAKVVPLVAFVAIGVLWIRSAELTPFAPKGYGPLGHSLLLAFFALSGFETSAIPAGEAARPTRVVPIAVVGSILGAAALYVLIQLVAVGVLPSLGESERPLADAARVFAGDAGARGVAILGAVSMVGLCAAMAFAGPRLLLALGQDDHLPRSLAREHPRFGTPHLAVAVTTAAAAALVLVLDFRRLVDFTSVVLVVQYLATCVSVVVLRRRRPDLPRAVRLPLGPAIPLLGAALLVWVLAQAQWIEVALAAASQLVGEIVFFAHRRAVPGR